MNHTVSKRTGPWFVVNMRNRWHPVDLIPRGGKPTKVHETLASAFAEAARLAETVNRGEFAVFECIGVCKSIPKKKPLVSAVEP